MILNYKKILKTNLKIEAENKKKGFTIIELIAVMAIIAILAIVAFPKISGYITKAKDTKTLSKAREVAMAAESYNCTTSTPIDTDEEYSKFKTKLTDAKYIDINQDFVEATVKYSELEAIMNGTKDYKIENDKISVK